MVYASRGDIAQAIEFAERAVQKAPTLADKLWAQSYLAWAWCLSGEPHRGIEILKDVFQISRARSFKGGEIANMILLGAGFYFAGEDDKAKQTLEEVVEIAKRCGANWWKGRAYCLLGEVALETDFRLASSHFKKSIAIFKEIKAENELALAYAGYGRFHKKQGVMALAREYFTKALEIFERLGTLIEPDKVREELAGLP